MPKFFIRTSCGGFRFAIGKWRLRFFSKHAETAKLGLSRWCFYRTTWESAIRF